jgi:hypothetical protein
MKELHQLNVLDRSGDAKLVWDTANSDEVEAARTMFNTLLKKGYQAFSVNPKGNKGEFLRTFDPEVGQMIMSPRLVGG